MPWLPATLEWAPPATCPISAGFPYILWTGTTQLTILWIGGPQDEFGGNHRYLCRQDFTVNVTTGLVEPTGDVVVDASVEFGYNEYLGMAQISPEGHLAIQTYQGTSG